MPSTKKTGSEEIPRIPKLECRKGNSILWKDLNTNTSKIKL